MEFGVNDIAFLKAILRESGEVATCDRHLSDRGGRKILIYPGMIDQGIGVWVVLLSANSFIGIIIGMSLLGVGTALVSHILLAAISDIAHPKWRQHL